MRVSRMLQDPSRVTPVEWRSGPGQAGKSPILSGGKAGPEDEIAALQAHIRALGVEARHQAQQAREDGYRDGEAAGRAAAEESVHAAVTQLAAAVAGIAGTRADTILRAEADTVRLAIEIARRILHRELTINVSALETLIRAALEKLQSQEVYRVRVHPDLEPVMRGCLEQAGRDGTVEIIKDPVQPKGGAVFEISRGTLDASVETQLREIELGLADRLEERS